MVKVKHFLAKVKVVDNKGSPRSDPQRVLVVIDRRSLRRCQDRRLNGCNLVQFAPCSPIEFDVVDVSNRAFVGR
jgi:hypothetical protein